MSRIRVFIVSHLIGLAVLLGSVAHSADMPSNARWRNSTINFFTSIGGTGGNFWNAEFIKAASRWTAPDVRMHFGGGAALNRPCFDRPPGVPIVNIVQFSSKPCDGEFSPETLAITTTRWLGNGELIRADIMFNSAAAPFDAYDGRLYDPAQTPNHRLDGRRIAVHELGHAAGISHIAGEPSIMNPVISDIYLPTQNDQERLRVKYSVPLGPIPPDSDDYRCPTQYHKIPEKDLGSISSSFMIYNVCLDPTQRSTAIYFNLNASRRMKLTVAGESFGVNVQLDHDTSRLWDDNSDSKVKETTQSLPSGRYVLFVIRGRNSGPFTVDGKFLWSHPLCYCPDFKPNSVFRSLPRSLPAGLPAASTVT